MYSRQPAHLPGAMLSEQGHACFCAKPACGRCYVADHYYAGDVIAARSAAVSLAPVDALSSNAYDTKFATAEAA